MIRSENPDLWVSGEGTKVLLHHEGNRGYGADQIETEMTLEALLEAVQTAIDEWGPQATVVTYQTNNQYGANYGSLSPWTTFSNPDADEDEDGDL